MSRSPLNRESVKRSKSILIDARGGIGWVQNPHVTMIASRENVQ
jgi:hypothetical protein